MFNVGRSMFDVRCSMFSGPNGRIFDAEDQFASQVDVGGVFEQDGNALVECENKTGSNRTREFGFDEMEVGTGQPAGGGSVGSGHAGEPSRGAAKR
jgi:hypothetical protein